MCLRLSLRKTIWRRADNLSPLSRKTKGRPALFLQRRICLCREEYIAQGITPLPSPGKLKVLLCCFNSEIYVSTGKSRRMASWLISLEDNLPLPRKTNGRRVPLVCKWDLAAEGFFQTTSAVATNLFNPVELLNAENSWSRVQPKRRLFLEPQQRNENEPRKARSRW